MRAGKPSPESKKAGIAMNKKTFLFPAASLSVLLLAACGTSASSSGASVSSTPPAVASPAASSGTFSTNPADISATELALDSSTAAYFNSRYGTQLPAAGEECESASSMGATSDQLWSCSYVIRGINETTIKLTGPHSWQIVPG
jgi:hypothetical protein